MRTASILILGLVLVAFIIHMAQADDDDDDQGLVQTLIAQAAADVVISGFLEP